MCKSDSKASIWIGVLPVLISLLLGLAAWRVTNSNRGLIVRSERQTHENLSLLKKKIDEKFYNRALNITIDRDLIQDIYSEFEQLMSIGFFQAEGHLVGEPALQISLDMNGAILDIRPRTLGINGVYEYFGGDDYKFTSDFICAGYGKSQLSTNRSVQNIILAILVIIQMLMIYRGVIQHRDIKISAGILSVVLILIGVSTFAQEWPLVDGQISLGGAWVGVGVMILVWLAASLLIENIRYKKKQY